MQLRRSYGGRQRGLERERNDRIRYNHPRMQSVAVLSLRSGQSGVPGSLRPALEWIRSIGIGCRRRERQPNIDFPSPGSCFAFNGDSDAWSVRWEGALTVGAQEISTLSVQASDGVTVWLDGIVLISSSQPSTARILTATLPSILATNSSHMLLVQYFHYSNPPEIVLGWIAADGNASTAVIPPSAFSTPYCDLPLVQIPSTSSAASLRPNPVFRREFLWSWISFNKIDKPLR